MAGWLKHHAKWILGSFACVVLLIVAGRAVYLNRQPDECALCGSGAREVYHAPVIVNLSTGEVSEMRVYDPSKTGRNNEISKIQTTGTFIFIYCAGITGIRDTCWHICKVEIPADAKHMVPSHFCSECRERLSASKKQGFTLADFYNDDAFEVGGEDIILDLFDVFPEFLRLNINGKSGAKNVFLYNPDRRCRIDQLT